MAEARLFTSIWDDKDFVALPRDAQRLYMFLLSQKDLTRCGLIALRPPRWAGKAAGLTAESVTAAVTVLHDTRFAIADWDTGELLVRSLIRRDEVWRQPNIMKSARRAATQIESAALRQVLLEELYRIPAAGSTSQNVCNEYAQFVEQLETSLGIAPRNPSENPSRNPSQNAAETGNKTLHPSARLFTSIWDDKDFVALPRDAQRLYMFLLSQKDLTRCGLIALRPPRWAGKAAGLTAESVTAAVTVLHDTRFAIADWDTGELLVRSLIRRDEVWRQPNIMKSARRAATQIESAALRQVLLEELYRIPAAGSTSQNVCNEYAQFVEQLETSLGIAPRNPSENPSRNPSQNAAETGNKTLHLAPGPAVGGMAVENAGSAGPGAFEKGSGNPSDDPSQGEGEGGIERDRRKHTPLAPQGPPRRRRRRRGDPPTDGMAPLIAAIGVTSPARDPAVVGALAERVAQIRPEWAVHVRHTLADPQLAAQPWERVERAMLAVARDMTSIHPNRVLQPGPWWGPPGPSRGRVDSATVREVIAWRPPDDPAGGDVPGDGPRPLAALLADLRSNLQTRSPAATVGGATALTPQALAAQQVQEARDARAAPPPEAAAAEQTA